MSGDELKRRLGELFSGEPPEPDVSASAEEDIGAVGVEDAAGEEEAEPVPETPDGSPLPVEEELEDETLSPAFAREYVERVQGQMLDLVIGGVVVAGGIAILGLLYKVWANPSIFVSYVPYFVGYALVLPLLLVRRVPGRIRSLVLIVLSYLVAVFSILANGVASTGPWYLFSASVLSFVLIGPRVGVALAVFNILLYEGFALAFRLGWLSVPVPIDLHAKSSQFWVVSATFVLISFGLGVTQWLFAGLQDRIQSLLRERVDLHRQMRVVSQSRQRELERANERLQRQAMYLELGLEVGRIGAQGLEATAFAERVVELISERLGLYLVELFVLDEERRYATLLAGAGAGAALSRPWQLEIVPSSLLGQCVSRGRASIVTEMDARADPSLPPPTRLAVALPMVARGEVIGVLLLQSQEAGAIREGDVMSLTAVADQVAASLSGARLYQTLQERVREMETMQRYYVREAWEQFLPGVRETLFEYARPGVPPLEGRVPPEVDRVLTETRLITVEKQDGRALLSPIALRDQVVGVLGMHLLDPERDWTEDEIGVVEAVAEQMGLIIENARLFEEARQRASEERLVREVTSRVLEAFTVEGVVRLAVDEIYRALNLEEVEIRLAPADMYPVTAGDEGQT